MKQKRIIIGILIVIFAVLCMGGIKYYIFLNSSSGAANNDLRKELSALEGGEYQAVLKANQKIEGVEVSIYEEMVFIFERNGLKKWNDSMPKADAEGTLFDTSNKICTYSCVAEICRYAVIDGERVTGSETSKTIAYTGYEDVEVNSVARAVIDNASRKVSYSHSINYFEDYYAQAEAALKVGNQEHTSELSFQPPIENIQWGMMPEEVMDIMKLSEKNILYQDESGASIRCEDMEVFGQKADVEMSFDIGYQLGLLGMRIIFEEPMQDEMADVLNNVYGEYCEVNDAGAPCKWESEAVKELPEEIQGKYRYVQVEVPAKRNLPGDFSQEAQWDVLKKQALVTVTLRNDIINYDAGNMAAYRNLYSDEVAYEEFLHRIE